GGGGGVGGGGGGGVGGGGERGERWGWGGGGGGDGDVGQGGPVGQQVHGGVVAQELVGRGDDQGGFAGQPGGQAGVAEQGEHAVGDEVDGGLVAGDQQQGGGGQQVAAGHRPVRAGVGEQAGDQVVAGVAGVGVGEPVEVLAELGVDPVAPAGPFVEGSGGGVDGVDDRVGPCGGARLVLGRDAEDLADRGHRQRVGDVVDDVGPGLAGEVVDQPGGDLGQPGPQAVDPPGSVGRPERPHRQLPEPVMAGRVAADEVEWQAGRALLSCGRG